MLSFWQGLFTNAYNITPMDGYLASFTRHAFVKS